MRGICVIPSSGVPQALCAASLALLGTLVLLARARANRDIQSWFLPLLSAFLMVSSVGLGLEAVYLMHATDRALHTGAPPVQPTAPGLVAAGQWATVAASWTFTILVAWSVASLGRARKVVQETQAVPIPPWQTKRLQSEGEIRAYREAITTLLMAHPPDDSHAGGPRAA